MLLLFFDVTQKKSNDFLIGKLERIFHLEKFGNYRKFKGLTLVCTQVQNICIQGN